MLFKCQFLEGVVAGDISLAFRRWRRPTVRPGGQLRTHAGVLAIDAVDVVTPADISAAEAQRAGFASRAALLAELGASGDGQLYRIALRFAGADPRVGLRQRETLGGDELTELRDRLARLDTTSRHGPWTMPVLQLIAARPAVRAAELAAGLGRETLKLKADVRKLKELGLTESLEVGYRLSPRGRAILGLPSD